MKKGICTCVLVLIIVSLHLPATSQGQQRDTRNNIYELSQQAYKALDQKVSVGFTRGFQLQDKKEGPDPVAPLFENMGDYSLKISTGVEMAQKYFDQGLRLTYGFNHAEAHRSFKEAARQDSTSAMAYWGQAYALGPNINDPLPDDARKKSAYKAIQKSLELQHGATEKEKDLINALSVRYGVSKDPTKPIMHSYNAGEKTDLNLLNEAYAQAMQTLAIKYPRDADIQTFYAASIMNMMPWNYWDNQGNANPGIENAQKALEKAIEINPRHPGAHHYYIHMMEKPKPELAIPSAEVLAGLMPAAGHIVHMPSHVFIRVGRYKDAAMTNIKAIYADEEYISQCYAQGMYPLGYYPHNIHFLWSSSSLMGNSATALAAASKTAQKVSPSSMETLPFLQDFYSTPMLSYVRFGKWKDILTVPDLAPYKHISLIRHYARGIAFVRMGNLKEAQEELDAIETMMNDPSLESLMGSFTNSSASIAKVAYRVVAGELMAARGDYDAAIEHLEKGVENEDALNYSEPAAWHIPVRQTLGAILLKADMPSEAETVYRQDLQKVPLNGWSTIGLYNSLIAQGKNGEARRVKAQFDSVWKEADIEISSSVF
ncbi:hypothetical protein [Rhodohalobacter sp.]|uniref:tetratricopeptide repeat protein n=1 Tax=Rhodohalobacter sp. TaxID=1974210 RepID=UPI002ACDC9CE|nr:hypothetical protein [Rhodohalobacter sp.]MDZ7757159.1 hypothetical protein [Rhodohalobacter sp.]